MIMDQSLVKINCYILIFGDWVGGGGHGEERRFGASLSEVDSEELHVV